MELIVKCSYGCGRITTIYEQPCNESAPPARLVTDINVCTTKLRLKNAKKNKTARNPPIKATLPRSGTS
jgi:hypothetical protein